MTPLLQLRTLTMQFDGVRALDSIDLELREGDCVGLIGPNGAGKSTLLNLIAGLFPPSQGEVWFRGQNVTRHPAHVRCARGIAKTFQLTRPFPQLTVLENVTTAAFLRHLDRRSAQQHAAVCLSALGLEHRAEAPASTLSTADRKRLEVARALATEPALLLLDECFSGLSPQELEDALVWAQKLTNLGIVLTEHLLRPVVALTRRTLVLDHGIRICEGTTDEVLRDRRVIEAYLGPDEDATA